MLDSFACPCCGVVSYYRADIEEQYCGRCHEWTADPVRGQLHMQEPCGARQQALVSQLITLLERKAGELAGHR